MDHRLRLLRWRAVTHADLIRRIDAVLVLDEGRFEASRQIIGDVLRECRDALTCETAEHPVPGCQRLHCEVCRTGMHAS